MSTIYVILFDLYMTGWIRDYSKRDQWELGSW